MTNTTVATCNEIPTGVSKITEETIKTMQMAGIKFNIITKVEHRVELHFAYERFDGRKCVHFVAELDGYGNLSDMGPYLKEDREARRMVDTILNANGEDVTALSKAK